MVLTMDNRDGFIWLDGQLIDWRSANVHILTHAMHYASAVFEGERAYNGVVFEQDKHHQRLLDGARFMGMDVPWSLQEINQAVADTLKANGLIDAYVRPIIWRGSERISVSAPDATIHLAIAAWPWPKYFSDEVIESGMRLDISKWHRPSPQTAPSTIKAAGLYMICTLSSNDALSKGYNDALLRDYRGDISEATGANIFLIRDGVIHTPDPHCILNGITRQTLIRLARDRGIEVVERRIPFEELSSFDEVFLTGTAYEVIGVSSIGEHTFTMGDTTRQLAKDYDDLVNRRV